MPRFSNKSKLMLSACDDKLKIVCYGAIPIVDFTVLCGHRGGVEQEKLYSDGRSKLRYPDSLHNDTPSKAVDIAPWPIPADWGAREPKELARFYHLMGVIKAVAHYEGIKVRLGGDWDGDNIFTDQSFDDLGHVELA